MLTIFKIPIESAAKLKKQQRRAEAGQQECALRVDGRRRRELTTTAQIAFLNRGTIEGLDLS